ncbi:MAG: glycoside hydrolase [bacterium]
MRTIKIFLLLTALTCSEQFAQNLFTNPGFENGLTDWDALWTRTPNAGTAMIVNSPVHSGNNAVRITHWGAEDWSFKHSGNVSVNPGEIYEFSAWVNVTQLTDWAELSIALFDANEEAINWSFAPSTFHSTGGVYQKFTTRFAVPEGTVYCWPRFIGGDSCDIYIDDVEFKLIGTTGEDQSHFLENEKLAVEILVPSFSINIYNKGNGKQYFVHPSNLFSLLGVDSTGNSFTFFCNLISQNLDVSIKVLLNGECLSFELSGDAEAGINEDLMFPGYIKSKPGEYLIIPWASGMILPMEEEYPFWEYSLYGWKATMAFAAVTDLNSGYMVVSDDPWDTIIRFDKPGDDDNSAIHLIHQSSKGKFGYNRKFYFVFIDNGGYVEMANWYRDHVDQLGYVKTFEEKITVNPNVEKLEGAVDFWALDWNFRLPEFIDSLVNFGIDKAIISLGGGWYNDEDLSEVIDTINNRGLLSSRYDIYTDVWPPTHPELYWYRTEGFPDDVVVKEDGTLQQGWLAYLDDGSPFQGYYTCSSTHANYARRWIADELLTDHYNCRFIDVELASQLFECYSTIHPATRKDDGQFRKDLLNVVKNEFNLVTGSEEARDFAFPVVDFGEGTMSIMPSENAGYDWMTPNNDPGEQFINYNMNPARRIPLHGLVYHDVHVPTWYTGDGLSKVPDYWDDKDLFNILYSSMPLVMPPSQLYWQQNKEKFITSMNLVSSLFRSCGFSKMISHQFISVDKKIQETTFENGWKSAVNFSNNDFGYGEYLLPSKGFYASEGTQKVYRVKTSQGMVAATVLEDRIFINPYGNEIELGGIKTGGTILLKKHEDYLSLIFIGNQSYVDINPGEIPWQIENIHVEGMYSHSPASTTSLANGWIRINKTGNELFYKISGDFVTDVKTEENIPFEFSLSQNYPNPFNWETKIMYGLPEPLQVKLIIYDILGREVIRLVDEFQLPAKYDVIWNGRNGNGKEVASGIYFMRLTAGIFEDIKNLLLLK